MQDISDREIEEEAKSLPWEKKKEEKIPEDLPQSIQAVLYDKIYIHKNKLHPFLKKKFIGLTVFHNPEYYLARNLRKSVQDIPMWIQCFDEDSDYLMLPIGLEPTFIEICDNYGVKVKEIDKRFEGTPIKVSFHGDLREKQVKAVEELLAAPNGILHANTAFGKTVAAIALIAERRVNTLIIVDRVSLLDQWCERLSVFLNVPKKDIGIIGGGKKKPTGIIDVAVSQSLYRDFLTLPISWSGRVKQYAGRLHRDYHEKKEVRIYDYLDSEIDTAMKMYGKRCKGYRSMGYEIIESK